MLRELAKQINNSVIGSTLFEDALKVAKENNLVVVYGESDDIMSFGGAISDEANCYKGGTAYVTNKGLLDLPECYHEEYSDNCKYFELAKEHAREVYLSADEDSPYWTIHTDIPHEVIDLYNWEEDDEDKELWCRGVVFSLDTL